MKNKEEKLTQLQKHLQAIYDISQDLTLDLLYVAELEAENQQLHQENEKLKSNQEETLRALFEDTSSMIDMLATMPITNQTKKWEFEKKMLDKLSHMLHTMHDSLEDAA